MGIGAQPRKAVSDLIELEALESRDQNYCHECNERDPKPREDAPWMALFAAGDGAQGEQEQQADEGHGDQLAEATPGVIRIGEALHVDVRLPAKEVAELDADKESEEQVHASQQGCRLHPSQKRREPGFLSCAHLLPLAGAQGVQEDTAKQVSTDRDIEKAEKIFIELFDIDEPQQLVQLLREHRVGFC